MKKNRVVAIGDFDGVHRGHQALLQALCAWAKELDAEPMAISFDRNTKGQLLLTPPETKEYFIRQCGCTLRTLPFEEWKEVSAETFAEDFLKKELNVCGLLSGGDLHFGKDRKGNECTLIAHGIFVKKMEDLCIGQSKISSSYIRARLVEGDLAAAEEALGHSFTLMGEVCHGKGLARQYGLPTVNIALDQRQLLPPFGVYAAWVDQGEQRWPAVANIGIRPTVEQGGAPNLEAHLLTQAGELYGTPLQIHLKQFLRPEKKFQDSQALFAQIKLDGERSKEVLNDE